MGAGPEDLHTVPDSFFFRSLTRGGAGTVPGRRSRLRRSCSWPPTALDLPPPCLGPRRGKIPGGRGWEGRSGPGRGRSRP